MVVEPARREAEAEADASAPDQPAAARDSQSAE